MFHLDSRTCQASLYFIGSFFRVWRTLFVSFGHNAVFGVANAVQSIVSGVGDKIGASSSPFHQTQVNSWSDIIWLGKSPLYGTLNFSGTGTSQLTPPPPPHGWLNDPPPSSLRFVFIDPYGKAVRTSESHLVPSWTQMGIYKWDVGWVIMYQDNSEFKGAFGEF